MKLLMPKGCIYYSSPSHDSAYKLLDSSLSQGPLGHYREVILMGDFNVHTNW